MLSGRNLNDKSYEQLIAEAIAQIPLYSMEWTNFNRSDPGITILENLSAFESLQREEINRVTESVKRKLLELAGFYASAGRAAVEYLMPAADNGDMPDYAEGQKIFVQDICYELPAGTTFATTGFSDISVSHDAKGQWEIRLFLNEWPKEEIYFYVDIREDEKRNPFGEQEPDSFVRMDWYLLTETEELKLKAVDGTHRFLNSGIVRLTMPKARSGQCVICGRIAQDTYDIAPKVNFIHGLLTPVVQRDTKSIVIAREGAEQVTIKHYLLKDGCFEVYRKEADGDYHPYRICTEESAPEKKRRCICRRKDANCIELIFPAATERTAGCGAKCDADGCLAERKDGILVICRESLMLPYQKLGRLYGYDDQEFPLPPLARVYTNNFSFLVIWKDTAGDEHMQWIKDGASGDGELRYHIEEEEQILVVEECGIYEGAVVLMGDYCLYQCAAGNVLPGTEMSFTQKGKTAVFHNTPGGLRGRYPESFEDVRKRFAADIRRPATIVTAEDCETLVWQIPGLSLHKVKAVADKEKNRIYVIVKPNGKEKFPKLSVLYQKVIREYLEERRLLATRIVIEQPQYVAIHVRGILSMKKRFDNGKEMVEEVLRQKLNGVHSQMNFGETLRFYEIYQEVECMECVEGICELTIWPGDSTHTEMHGLDIRMKRNVLCYAGEITLEEGAGGYGV